MNKIETEKARVRRELGEEERKERESGRRKEKRVK